MIEHPLLMSGAMVRSSIEIRKSQTRRVGKPQPGPLATFSHLDQVGQAVFTDGTVWRARYGRVGDRLWCRETWLQRPDPDDELGGMEVLYRATDTVDADLYGGWRPSIFMPRWASRITLEITDVRVERLQDITPDDAEAEGIPNPCGYYCDISVGHVDHQGTVNAYAELWDSINAKRGYPWASDPWVWCIAFQVLK